MKRFVKILCDGIEKELGMIVALILLAMPPMLFHHGFFGGLHGGIVNGFDDELWRQLKYPIVDMGLLILLVFAVVEFVHLMGRKWLKWMLYSIAISIAVVRIWLWWVFSIRITPVSLRLLMETNVKESSEFVETYLFGWYGVGLIGMILGLVLLCLLFEKANKMVAFNVAGKKIAIGVSILCVLWGLVEFRWNVRLMNCQSEEDVRKWQDAVAFDENNLFAFNFQAVLFSVVSNKSAAHDMLLCARMAKDVNMSANSVFCEEDSLVVVFVLGESHIKSHCALYGYKRNTSPKLLHEKAKGILFVFDDVVSPFTKTTDVVKTVFFTNNLSEKWKDAAFFPQLFKMAGYEVDMWDNHHCLNSENGVTTFLSSILFDATLKNLSYSNVSDIGYVYDEVLVNDYFSKHFDLDTNRFIVFHLYGQHIDATKRFPHTIDNMVFNGVDKISTAIAMYDNACLYNDKVLAKIIDIVRDKKSVVVYLSDHGEEVYDYRNHYGRKEADSGLEKEYLKYQSEVPFIIWCSDKYKTAYPEIIKHIEASVDKPFITDNVCQVMFHLSGLKSPWYHGVRDLLSTDYKCEKRVVNGLYDYDEVMRR